MSAACAAQPAAACTVVGAVDQINAGRFDTEVSPD